MGEEMPLSIGPLTASPTPSGFTFGARESVLPQYCVIDLSHLDKLTVFGPMSLSIHEAILLMCFFFNSLLFLPVFKAAAGCHSGPLHLTRLLVPPLPSCFSLFVCLFVCFRARAGGAVAQGGF